MYFIYFVANVVKLDELYQHKNRYLLNLTMFGRT